MNAAAAAVILMENYCSARILQSILSTIRKALTSISPDFDHE